jgi:hypothetical protein
MKERANYGVLNREKDGQLIYGKVIRDQLIGMVRNESGLIVLEDDIILDLNAESDYTQKSFWDYF